nr:hypothetical protein [Psychrobacter sp. KH172YL61]
MTHPTQDTPVIPFTDNTPHDTEPTSANSPAMQLPTTGMGRAKDILPFLPLAKPPCLNGQRWTFPSWQKAITNYDSMELCRRSRMA